MVDRGLDHEAYEPDPLEAFERDMRRAELAMFVVLVCIGCALGAIVLVLWR